MIIKVKFKKFIVNDECEQLSKYNLYQCDKKNIYLREYFDKSEFDNDLENMLLLKRANIPCNKLITYDKKKLIIVVESIEGKSCLSLLENNDIDDKIIEKLFVIYRFARFCKIEINYLPEYFIYNEKGLYYIDDFVSNQDSKINLENYGLRYWLESTEAKKYIQQKGLNSDKMNVLSSGEINKKIVLHSINYW